MREVKIYEFDELTPMVQQKVIRENRYWDYSYELRLAMVDKLHELLIDPYLQFNFEWNCDLDSDNELFTTSLWQVTYLKGTFTSHDSMFALAQMVYGNNVPDEVADLIYDNKIPFITCKRNDAEVAFFDDGNDTPTFDEAMARIIDLNIIINFEDAIKNWFNSVYNALNEHYKNTRSYLTSDLAVANMLRKSHVEFFENGIQINLKDI